MDAVIIYGIYTSKVDLLSVSERDVGYHDKIMH
jgi:hypothetical protein